MGYMVQNASYIFDAIKCFKTAAAKMQGSSTYPPDYSLFYRGRATRYEKYSSEYFVSKWNLKSGESVIMDPAAATYTAFLVKLAETDPRYLAIGVLPCAMLWPWIAAKLTQKSRKNTSIGHGLMITCEVVSQAPSSLSTNFSVYQQKKRKKNAKKFLTRHLSTSSISFFQLVMKKQ